MVISVHMSDGFPQVKGDPGDCKSVKYIWVLQYDPERGWLVNEDVIGAREAIW